MTTPIVYVICDQNCKFEGMTKEQIYTAIMQAVNEGTIGNIDAGFITTIKTINGTPLKFFVGEQAAYDELTDEDKKDLFAIITNDTSKKGIEQAIKELQEAEKNNVAKLTAHEVKLTAHELRLTNLENHNNKLPLVCAVTVTDGETKLPLDKIEENTPYLMVFEKSSGAGYGARYSAIYIHNVCISTTVIIGDWRASVAGETTGDSLLDVAFYDLYDYANINEIEISTVDGALFLYKLGTIETEISFTISDNPYTARAGMTWKEFINSTYNADGRTYAHIYQEEEFWVCYLVDPDGDKDHSYRIYTKGDNGNIPVAYYEEIKPNTVYYAIAG